MSKRVAKGLCSLFAILAGGRSAWGQLCDSGVVFSAPIVITQGGIYTGNWESTSPSVAAVTIHTGQPVTIINSRMKGPFDLIRSAGSDAFAPVTLTVQNSCFVGTNPNIAGQSKGTAIDLFAAVNVLVQFCDFESTGMGVYDAVYDGNFSSNQTIKVLNNRFHSIDGRLSDGQGGYQTARGDLRSAIQLNTVLGVPGIEIAWNQIVEDPNQSRVEDTISLYATSGTQASPILVHDNYVQGSYATVASMPAQLAFTGQVINTDGPPTTTDPTMATGFVKIHDNQAVSISFNGIGTSAGHDIEVYSNRVVSSGQLSDGTNISDPYGTGVINQNYYQQPAGVFGNNSFHDNVSGFRFLGPNGIWGRADYDFSAAPTVNQNNAQWNPTTGTAPTLTDEANELLLWNEKLIANAITIGSTLVVPALNGTILQVSGNNQVGAPNGSIAATLIAQVVNTAGAPVAGVNVAFMVTSGNATASQPFAITDANGLASTGLTLAAAPAAVQVNVIAAGHASTSFNVWITQPPSTLSAGGVAGVGGSVPPVQTLSQNALVSIYGQNFLSPGVTGRRVLSSEFVNGGLPNALLGVCVDIGGQPAAMLDVYPAQLNVQVPAVSGRTAAVQVRTNCGTPVEVGSNSQSVAVTVASPEFLYFQINANGQNPIALVNANTGALVGPSNILSGALTPAHAGDILTAYATGFGPLTPPAATGQIPTGIANAVGPISVSIGGVSLASSDILYAGAAPNQVIDQLNFRVPAGIAAGHQPIVISVGSLSSPPNAFVAVQ